MTSVASRPRSAEGGAMHSLAQEWIDGVLVATGQVHSRLFR